jgi:DNA-binding response OmpR family regulator
MRILIAEDDQALGQFLSRGLEADGHRVRIALDGGAAVEAFREEMPDLTILDLNMPVKDGEQVLEEVRLLDADLPVLELDRLDHSARRSGQKIDLTNKEFALLEHLLLNRGQCVSRVELLESVWNFAQAQTTNIVDVYVNYLRRKIADPAPGQLIRTVRGRGYMVPLESELATGAGLAPRAADSDRIFASGAAGGN